MKVFQRTPGWVLPRFDFATPPAVQTVFAKAPAVQQLARQALYWGHEASATALVWNTPLTSVVARLGRMHLNRQVKDPWLRRQLTPDFTPGCKRMLVSSDYYPALQRDNCKLIDWPIATLSPVGVRTSDGIEHHLDCIVFATGYDVHLTGPPFPVTGLGGRSLSAEWTDGAQAYKSASAHGYPNLFFMTGPNSGPGHNSLLVYIEGQLDYAVRGITTILDNELRYLDVRRGCAAPLQRTHPAAAHQDDVDVGLQQLVFDQGRTQRIDVSRVRHPVSSTDAGFPVRRLRRGRKLPLYASAQPPERWPPTDRPALKPAPSPAFWRTCGAPPNASGGNRGRSSKTRSRSCSTRRSAIRTVRLGSGEYRIEDLARLAGTTTRNIRVYRDRGLLPPPLRVGRIALYNDTHLTRLRLITSMLDRGYNIAHVREMLSAWEEGKDLGDVLGLETAIVGTWTTEKSQTMPLAEAQRLINDAKAFDRLVRLHVIHVDDAQATITRPKLIEAFNEIRGYGMSMDKLVDLHEHIVPLIDQISEMLVRAGAEHVADRIKPARSSARRHRNRRADHDAGAVSHPGRRVGHRHPGVVDRIDHRVTGQPDPGRVSGARRPMPTSARSASRRATRCGASVASFSQVSSNSRSGSEAAMMPAPARSQVRPSRS